MTIIPSPHPRAARLPILLLLTLLTGCQTVERARHAQSPEGLTAGETTVTSAAAGIHPGTTNTLETLQTIALLHHPALLQARQNAEAAHLQYRITRSARHPQLTASGGYNRATHNTWGQSTSSEMSGSWSAAIGLDLLLYDFGKLDAQDRQAIEAIIAAEEQLREAELDITYTLRAAFYERHRSQHLLRVAIESEDQYAQHFEEARVMVEVGTRRPYDRTKAEVDWGNARLEVVTATNNLAVAHASLNRALALADNPAYELTEHHPPIDTATADALMETARQNAPSLAILRARERAASAYVDQTIAELYPDLSLAGDASLSGRDFPFIWNFSWALRAAQNLFDGHRKTARIDHAVTQLRIARANTADAEQTLYLDIVTAAAQRASAQKRTEIARLVSQQATENLDIVNEQFRVGLSSSIERTDAQVTLTQAQADLIRARYDECIAQAKLDRLIGLPASLPTPPDNGNQP